MTPPIDDADVREAYRELPAPEPSAGLDARVRAAVAAELAAGSAGRAATARVIPFPRWRRVALPLATAATVLVAAGLWQWRQAHEARPAAGATLDDSLARSSAVPKDEAAAPEPPAAGQLAAEPTGPVPAARVAQAPSAPPPALAAARTRRAEPMAEAKLAEVADQAAAAPAAPAPALAARAAVPLEQARSNAARAAGSLQADVVAGKEADTFAQARQLLAAHRPDEARALLARWRATHAAEVVPEDLRPLLPDPPR